MFTLGRSAWLLVGLTLLLAVPSCQEPKDAEISGIVRRALSSNKVLYILPRGVDPGSLGADRAAEMQEQAFLAYEEIYTGPLLESRRQVFLRQLEQMTTDPMMAVTRDGGVRDLAFSSVEIITDTAVATGTYTSWLVGEDPQSDTPNEEVEISSKRQFEIHLVKVNGEWRIEAENVY